MMFRELADTELVDKLFASTVSGPRLRRHLAERDTSSGIDVLDSLRKRT